MIAFISARSVILLAVGLASGAIGSLGGLHGRSILFQHLWIIVSDVIDGT
jgi:hypothetical protein